MNASPTPLTFVTFSTDSTAMQIVTKFPTMLLHSLISKVNITDTMQSINKSRSYLTFMLANLDVSNVNMKIIPFKDTLFKCISKPFESLTDWYFNKWNKDFSTKLMNLAQNDWFGNFFYFILLNVCLKMYVSNTNKTPKLKPRMLWYTAIKSINAYT